MSRTGLFAVALACLLPPATPGAGGEAPQPAPDGELLFRVHCASCHGPAARGDGPMREVLKVAPSDLTRLRASHDGEFPRDRCRELIDGRGELQSHGSREMPVWGMTFQDPGRTDRQEDEVGQRIDALLGYLESLQK